MAKEDELELDAKAAKSGGGKGKLIMLLAAVILLTSGSIIAVLYFMGMLGNIGGAGKSADKTAAAHMAAIKPSYYLSLDPPFTVNFEDQSHASYLQVAMQVMAHNKKVLSVISANMPLVRNNILLILSAQKFEQVSTLTGKEQLQHAVLQAIQKVVDQAEQPTEADKKDKKSADGKAAAEPDKVAQVYFTSFIMQ